jgi:hypothetical protein
VCAKQDGRFSPVFIPDAKRLGEGGDSAKTCLTMVKAAREGVVCTNSDGNYVPTRVKDGSYIGNPMDLGSCVKSTAEARDGLICTGIMNTTFALTRINGGERASRGTTLDECLTDLAKLAKKT